jgi:ankyrin repeat protein
MEYNKLFLMLKNNKYDDFINYIKNINDNNLDITFDINIRDAQQNYFLTYAVALNQPNIVKVLLDKNAKIDITNKNDESVLTIALTYSYFEIMEILLKKNSDSIGISIIDIRDKNMKIPLHLAIELQNIEAIKMLLKYGSNVNLIDKNGFNSLHFSIRTRNIEICKLIVPIIADINARYKTGETALHMACNYESVEIAKLLITNGINVNIQDYSNEITPLCYSILSNNIDLIELLLNSGAEVNLQDSFGNTSLHYCIIENNIQGFKLLINFESTKNTLNLNVWNMYGEIPLHLVLKGNVDNLKYYLNNLIDKSNLTIQDNDGNTCLYYLIKLNLWKNYKTNLIKKRLDIFSLNSNNEYPIDIVNGDDFDDFIDMIVNSYLNRIKEAKELWYEEWENICSKNFIELSDIEKKKLIILMIIIFMILVK